MKKPRKRKKSPLALSDQKDLQEKSSKRSRIRREIENSLRKGLTSEETVEELVSKQGFERDLVDELILISTANSDRKATPKWIKRLCYFCIAGVVVFLGCLSFPLYQKWVNGNLVYAVQFEGYDEAKKWIGLGAEVNVLGTWSSHRSAELRPLDVAVLARNPWAIRLLLDEGANIDAQSEGGNTALQRAIYNQCPEEAEVLLSRGAAMDIKNDRGKTALERWNYGSLIIRYYSGTAYGKNRVNRSRKKAGEKL